MGASVRDGSRSRRLPASRLSTICVCCISGGVPRRSFVVALIVGTILNLINQGDALFGDGHLNLTKAILTFAVPYCVATYGAVSLRLSMAQPTRSDRGERTGPIDRLVWGVLGIWIRLRRGRRPPPRLPDPVWYFAYGANMNEQLFRQRRRMGWHEVRIGRLDGYRLAFTVAGGRHPGISAPANIVAAPDKTVYGVLYLLPLRKFAHLDASEGRQYCYLWAEVDDATGNRVSAITYTVANPAPEGRPGSRYLDVIREAARQRDLPAAYIDQLDKVRERE